MNNFVMLIVLRVQYTMRMLVQRPTKGPPNQIGRKSHFLLGIADVHNPINLCSECSQLSPPASHRSHIRLSFTSLLPLLEECSHMACINHPIFIITTRLFIWRLYPSKPDTCLCLRSKDNIVICFMHYIIKTLFVNIRHKK